MTQPTRSRRKAPAAEKASGARQHSEKRGALARFSRLALSLAHLELGAYLRLWHSARVLRRSGLVDTLWYRTAYPGSAAGPREAVAHWMLIGCAEGRNPHPLFDTSWYLGQYPDAAAERSNPLLHYLERGAVQGHDPHPLFDTSFYLSRNPDVALANANPLVHYLQEGAAEGRNPHPLFDTSWYLSRNPEVADAGINPLVHYVERGAAVGRDPHPLFDTSWYLGQVSDTEQPQDGPLIHFLERGAARGWNPSALFDVAWYLKQYPEVAQTGDNPLVDYALRGVEKQRSPGPDFDSPLYLAVHPEVAEVGENPLARHLEDCGRDPSATLEAYAPPRVDGLAEDLVAEADRSAARIRSIRAAAAFRWRPRLSLVVTVVPSAVEAFQALAQSVLAQTYRNWELHVVPVGGRQEEVIEAVVGFQGNDRRVKLHRPSPSSDIPSALNEVLPAVRGAYFAQLDCGGVLFCDALTKLVEALNAEPNLDFLYADQIEDGDPAAKTDWSPLFLCALMYIGKLVLMRTELVREIGGFDGSFGDAWEHAHLLRLSEQARQVGHVRQSLYRTIGSSAGAPRRFDALDRSAVGSVSAVAAHLQRTASTWTAVPNPLGVACVELLSEPPRPGTRLGVLVNADRSANAAQTSSELLKTASRNSVQLVPLRVHGNGGDGFTPGIGHDGKETARLVANSDCDFIAIVDDGVRIETPNWADRLTAFADLEGIGLVAGILLDSQGLIAEAGLVLEPNAVVYPSFVGCDPQSVDCPIGVYCTREVAAVSSAFAVISKDVFEQVGGVFGYFSSSWFAWTDLALRAREVGLRNLVCSQVIAMQAVRRSTGGASSALDRAVFRDRWQARLAEDASRHIHVSSGGWGNPALTRRRTAGE